MKYHHLIMQRQKSHLVIWLFFIIAFLWLFKSPVARADLGFTVVGTHPQAAAQPSLQGRGLKDLMVKDNLLYVGYGDWQTNTGPIHLNPFNLDSKLFTGSVISVPTESIEVIRKINDAIYAPMTDPKGSWTSLTSGFATDASGSFQNVTGFAAMHVFDVATLDGTDIWAAGSSVDETGSLSNGTAWRSTDGGESWQVMQEDTPTPSTGVVRYYWIARLNNKIYTSAYSFVDTFLLKGFDGTSWSTRNNFCYATRSKLVEVFADKIICQNITFDGSEVRVTNLPNNDPPIIDFYVDGDYLYVMTGASIYRTTDFSQIWQRLGDTPEQALSLAVYDDRLYLGDWNSQVLESTVLLSSFSELPLPSDPTTPPPGGGGGSGGQSGSGSGGTQTNAGSGGALWPLAKSGANIGTLIAAAGIIITSSALLYVSIQRLKKAA